MGWLSPCLLPVRRGVLTLWDRFLGAFQDVEASLGWARELGGGLTPVTPARNVPLSVKSGRLPADLGGAYMRVGPNAQFWPPRKRTHVFDGDGMVHSIRFANGGAVYHCEFLETPRYKFEREWGGEFFTRIGEFHGLTGLAKILTVVPKKARLSGIPASEANTGNTTIGFTPEGKLWALNEAGKPFRFRLDQDGVPRSLGHDDLAGTLNVNISAHPKFDQRTGETFFHGRQIGKSFYAGRMSGGKLTDLVDIKMQDGFHHDMFITENYMVLVDGSMRFTPEGIVKGKPLWMFEQKRNLRFGVFPRAAGKMAAQKFVWIEAPAAAEIVHTLYAYDQGGTIVLWTPMFWYKEGKESGVLGNGGPTQMRRIVIDVERKTVDVQGVRDGALYETEFPRIRDDRVGLRVSHGFSGIQAGDTDFNFTGLLKWDFESVALAGTIHFPEGVVGGEPVFLPRSGGGSDDDGYIGLFLWNHKSEESTFVVYDAQSFSPTPVVELLVPRRVPLGFHAAWITEDQFQQQLCLP